MAIRAADTLYGERTQPEIKLFSGIVTVLLKGLTEYMSGWDKNVISFLQNLEIKSARLSGFDRVDVFEKLKELSAMYEEILERERKAYQEKLSELQKALSEVTEERDSSLASAGGLEKQVNVMKLETQQLIDDLKQKYELIETERERVLEEAASEAAVIISSARAIAEETTGQTREDLAALKHEEESTYAALSQIHAKLSQLLGRREPIADDSLRIINFEDKKPQSYINEDFSSILADAQVRMSKLGANFSGALGASGEPEFNSSSNEGEL